MHISMFCNKLQHFFSSLSLSLSHQLKALFNRKLTLFYSLFIIKTGLVK